MTPITIHPGKLSQLGTPHETPFCLITNPEISDSLQIAHDADYSEFIRIMYRSGDTIEDLFAHEVPERAHVLAISPERLFASPDPEVLGPNRKLLAMACNSTPASLDVIRHFLAVIESTSAQEQDEFSDRFFELAESSNYLRYVDDRHGTQAILEHLTDGLVWNQQAGALEWGEQQLVPSGEISVLPIDFREFDVTASLPLNGTIALRGYPILHSGTPSFTRADQARVRSELATMEDSAVIANIVDGKITELHAEDNRAEPAVRMLEAMFAVDSRYRHVWEMGHSFNASLKLLPGNHAMNEVYGGTRGCLHWGIGLTPYTQYHLDVISPDTTVLTEAGEIVLGMKGGDDAQKLAGSGFLSIPS